MELNSLIICILLLIELSDTLFICWFSFSLEDLKKRKLVSLKIFSVNLEQQSLGRADKPSY